MRLRHPVTIANAQRLGRCPQRAAKRLPPNFLRCASCSRFPAKALTPLAPRCSPHGQGFRARLKPKTHQEKVMGGGELSTIVTAFDLVHVLAGGEGAISSWTGRSRLQCAEKARGDSHADVMDVAGSVCQKPPHRRVRQKIDECWKRYNLHKTLHKILATLKKLFYNRCLP